METEQITKKLHALKKKQAQILETWKRASQKDVVQFITEFIPDALKAERCSVFVVDPERSDVWIQSGTELEEKEVTIPLESESIVGDAIRSGVYQQVDDLEEKLGAHVTAAVKTGFIARNALCVPVHNSKNDKVIGAIQLLNKAGGLFTRSDRKTLERLAEILQVNIEQMYQRQELLNISNEMEETIKKLEHQLIKLNLQQKS
jgi:GAF domain-containing protein